MLTYVVFCRLDGLHGLDAGRIAASVGGLAEAVNGACTERASEPLVSQSSVFGRFVLGTTKVRVALDLADDVLQRASSAGAPVTLGVACGEAAQTPDLVGHNYIGAVVNRAARLACLPTENQRIAVEERVAEDALRSGSFNGGFDERREAAVKHTKLTYHLRRHKTVKLRRPPTRLHNDAQIAHVVVYDLVDFSHLLDGDQRAAIRNLNDVVEMAFGEAGGGPVRECGMPRPATGARLCSIPNVREEPPACGPSPRH
jgi:hypothetical protein